jgi:hypothetical protein
LVGPLVASNDSLCLTLVAIPAYGDTMSGESLVIQRWLAIRTFSPDTLETVQIDLILDP